MSPWRCSDAGRRGFRFQARKSELTTIWAQLQRAHPDLNQKLRVRLVPYSATAGGNSIISTQGNRMLAIFSVVTVLTIAIVCANVANLLIARAVVRQREMALRQSLGASRARIVRGLLAEGLVLSVVAWIVACLFAWIVSQNGREAAGASGAERNLDAGSRTGLDGGRLRARARRCCARLPSRSVRPCGRGGSNCFLS